MKKYYMNFFLAGCLLGLTGCGTSEVSCSGDTESKLIEDILLPHIKDKFIVETLNEKDPGAGMTYALSKQMENLAETFGKDPSTFNNKQSPYLKEVKAEMEKEFKNYEFSLHDVRTTSKDKELNKVECSGAVTVKLDNYEMNYKSVVYRAQLGDDKENVYVEVDTME